MSELVSPAGTFVSVGGGPLEARLLGQGWKLVEPVAPIEPVKPKRGRPKKTIND